MEHNWVAFMTRLGKEPAGVSVDVLATQGAEALRHLTILLVHARSQRENGFPSKEDFDEVYAFEDGLDSELDDKRIRYVGRLVVKGSFFLHFYSDEAEPATKRVRELAACFHDRQEIMATREEPDWSTYREILSPSIEQWQEIMDRSVIDNLTRSGDNLTMPRPVDHYFYFKTPQGREIVAEKLAGQGFQVRRENERDTGEHRWPLLAQKEHHVRPGEITELTVSLLHLASEHDGTYDGWGCVIVK